MVPCNEHILEYGRTCHSGSPVPVAPQPGKRGFHSARRYHVARYSQSEAQAILCRRRHQPRRPPLATARSASTTVRRAARQDVAFNLSPNRRLCNTVGGRIGPIVEGCAAYRCAVAAALFRAATMANLARASLALVLRAVFGGAKSCASVNLFMICPPPVS
jgi:hypothetical protein